MSHPYKFHCVIDELKPIHRVHDKVHNEAQHVDAVVDDGTCVRCRVSGGEVAFRESLCPQYTSERHGAKGLRTYHITGTYGGTSISRIACGRLGGEVAGADAGPLHITITSNTDSWQEGDLYHNSLLVSLDLDMQRAVKLPSNFLTECVNLKCVGLNNTWKSFWPSSWRTCPWLALNSVNITSCRRL